MKTALALISLAVLSGCATAARQEVSAITSPAGAHVFVKDVNRGESAYLGAAPLIGTVGFHRGTPGEIVAIAWKPGYLPATQRIPFNADARVPVFLALKADEEEGLPTLSRELFNLMAMGRTIDELIAIFGRPSSTQTSGNTVFIYYDGMTLDTLSETVDIHVQVIVELGRVVGVYY